MMEPLAKPSGVTLRSHRQHVYDEASRLVGAPAYRNASAKYNRLVGEDLARAVKRAAWWHDLGKEHPVWQRACRADYGEYRAWRRSVGLVPDEVNAADYERYERELRKAGRAPGRHLRNAGIRHEFESLRKAAEKKVSLSLPEQAAIAAHHGKLNYRHEHRWRNDGEGYADLWESFYKEHRLLARWRSGDWERKILARYRIAGVRGLLQLADARASRAEAGGWLPPVEAFAYTFPEHWTRRRVQKAAVEHANQRVIILRAPTGSGKTDAALLWAQHQVQTERADRLVIALPTRFTSNALAVNVSANISGTGLYHSSAWHVRYGGANQPEQLPWDHARERHKMARLLATPATVCTLDHLLISLTGTREDHHTVFFHLANSAVVIDEADFYDPFVQANLTVLLDCLRTLDVPVLIMSATVPESARSLYRVENRIAEATAGAEEPVRSLAWAGDVERPENVAPILDEMWEAGAGIVYANTVASALAFYDWFRKRKIDSGGSPIILYHSRFTEPDKQKIEKRLIDALGKAAWDPEEPGTASGIAILTQIGEMSVNISAPLMLSELCPWDRLAQRAGRLNRFGRHRDAKLYIVRPVRKEQLYPAPYGSPLPGGGWEANPALLETERRLRTMLPENKPSPITAAEFIEEVNLLYPVAPHFDSRAADNRRRLLDLMRNNWLIVPRRGSDEDRGTVAGEWCSRDIDPQTTVFVALPAAVLPERGDPDASAFHFRSYDELRGFELDHAVSCPAYLVQNELRRKENSQVTPCSYTIGDDKGERPLHYTDCYDSERGLLLGITSSSTDTSSTEPDGELRSASVSDRNSAIL
jgi:CRISPR-associated endonuclease/helicase Cas3